MTRLINKKSKTYIAICIFLILFSFIQVLKPTILYNKNGSLRDFGIGYKQKTVTPMWLITILIAILSYFFVVNFM
jgi:hypothetical protein